MEGVDIGTYQEENSIAQKLNRMLVPGRNTSGPRHRDKVELACPSHKILMLKIKRTLRITNVVLLSCRKGRLAGVHTPWMAIGISRARCSKNTTDLVFYGLRSLTEVTEPRKATYRGLRRWIDNDMVRTQYESVRDRSGKDNDPVITMSTSSQPIRSTIK
jgi:hypothetical protein